MTETPICQSEELTTCQPSEMSKGRLVYLEESFKKKVGNGGFNSCFLRNQQFSDQLFYVSVRLGKGGRNGLKLKESSILSVLAG